MIPHPHHLEAAKLREANQTQEALQAYVAALITYVKQNDPEGQVRVLLEQTICFLHLFDQDQTDMWLAQAFANLNVAESLLEGNDLPEEVAQLFALGTGNAFTRTGEWQQALEWYEQAEDTAPATGLLAANLQAHVAYAAGKIGDEQALDGLAEAIQVLQVSDHKLPEPVRRTWLSGAYLKQAELYQDMGEFASAQHAVELAEKTAQQDLPLAVRLNQIEIFKKNMRS